MDFRGPARDVGVDRRNPYGSSRSCTIRYILKAIRVRCSHFRVGSTGKLGTESVYVVSVPGSTPMLLLLPFAFRPPLAPRHGGFVAVFDHFCCVCVDCCVMTIESCISVAVKSLFSRFGALLAEFCTRVPSLVVMTMVVFSSFVLFPCIFVDCCVNYDNLPYKGHDNVALIHHGSFADMLYM